MKKEYLYIVSGLLLVALLVSMAPKGEKGEVRSVKRVDRVLCLGDSLTFGFGTQNPDTESYPAVLGRLTGVEVIGAGINGETSAEILSRTPGLLKRYRPDLVILCSGGNDILQGIDEDILERNLRETISEIERSGAGIILIGVPHFGLTGLKSLSIYEDLADRYNLPYMGDLLPEILSEPSMKSDYIHPNAGGYEKMAEEIAEKMYEEGMLTLPPRRR
jgi:lysophospholipase L1-like esterase